MVVTTFGEQIPLSKIGEDEGWYYSTDFAGYSNSVGHDVKGMTHFVRRRKLQRVCVYDGEQKKNNFFSFFSLKLCKLLL